MATYVIYADAADGYVYAESTVYNTARAGSGTKTAVAGNVEIDVGQYKSTTTYYVYEGFLSFDTSSVTGLPTSATLSVYVFDDGATSAEFTMNARAYDWGASLTTADFVAGASLSGSALRATLATSGITNNAYNDFTSESTFHSNVSNPVRLILSSSRTEAGTSDATNGYSDYIGFRSTDQTGTSNDPKLTIVVEPATTFTADAVVIDRYDRTVLDTSGLQSYWKLDETSGSTAADSKGSVSGTKGSDVTFGSTKLPPGCGGYAATFGGDPTNANIDLGNNYKFSGTSAWTIEVWFNSTNFNPTNGSNHIFGAYDGTNGYRAYVTSGGGLGAQRKTSGADDWLSTTTLSTSTTYHLVVTYDGSNIRGYINGSLDATGAVASSRSLTAASTNAFISSTYSGVGAMVGRLDNVAVYNTALSAATVADHYAMGNGSLTTTFTADAIVQDNTRTTTFTADAVVIDRTMTTTFAADAHIVGDAWGYGAWTRRKRVGITGSTAAQTNYPVTITVTYDADMNTDFSDLRFTAADGSTALTFWRDPDYVASTSAKFYIVVPTLKAGTTSFSGTVGGGAMVYAYYGNSAATYAGVTRGANSAFLSYDGGAWSAIPRGSSTGALERGTSSAWDDSYITLQGALVKNLDGTLYVDGDGYCWGVYNGANQARRATVDTSAPYDGDNAPGDDCPGFFKFLATNPASITKVSTSDPFIKWGSGTWDPSSGTTWDGRVVQQGHIFHDADGDLVTAGTFICFYDGDQGPANVYEAYRQGVATASTLTGTWTKKSTGNPSGQAWTFAHSYLNLGSTDDMIAYAGSFIYDVDEADSDKRWKQWYTGHTGSKWGIMMATSPTYYGPWTRQSASYVWQPRPSDGAYDGLIDWAFKLRGIYYIGYQVLGKDTDTDGRKKWAFYVGRSEDGINWTLDGEFFNRSTSAADWDYGRMQDHEVFYNPRSGKWNLAYTASATGNGAAGDDPAYVPDLKVAITEWTATPAYLVPEPDATLASEQVAAPLTFTADAVIASGVTTQNTRTFTADAVVKASATKTFTADAIVSATVSGSGTFTQAFTVDAIVDSTPGATFTAGLMFYSVVGQELEFWGQD